MYIDLLIYRQLEGDESKFCANILLIEEDRTEIQT